MYLLYLDDSGAGEVGNGDYFVLGGVCVEARHVPTVTEALNQIARRLHPDDPNVVEFHASALWHGKEFWKSLNLKPDQRRQLLREVLAVVADTEDGIRLFAAAEHKHDRSDPTLDPVQAAFVAVAGGFELFLRRIDGHGLLILDESAYSTRLRTIDRLFRRPTAEIRFERIVDGPLFVSSKEFRCTQLADHVAYSVFRRYEAGDATYFDQIAHRFDVDGRIVHGLVHGIRDRNRCLCPACLSRR